MTFNSAAHPRVAAGNPTGGQFTAGQSQSASGTKKAQAQAATRKLTLPSVPPNGLGYTDAQWAQLRAWEAIAKRGGKLTKHQQHMLHVAHLKRLRAHMPKTRHHRRRHHVRNAKQAPKPLTPPKVRTVKMSSQVYTPFHGARTVELSAGRWRKQLLPLGTIVYKGRKIEFSRDYLQSMVDAFRDRAVDRVPFQLAGPDNKHTNAVLARGGTIVDVELMPDGLDIILESPNADTAKMLDDYPDTGVSARIYEDYTREHDGKHWTAVLQHVLATNDEHITGLRPWAKLEPVALSSGGDDVETIDLTGEKFEVEKEVSVPRSKTSLKAILAKLNAEGDEADLTDEELDRLLAIVNQVNDSDDTEAEDDDEELTDEELDELITAAEAEGAGAPSGATATVSASQRRRDQALELTQSRLDQQALELAAMREALDEQNFAAEVTEFASRYGIPPFITLKAKRLLCGTGHVVDLSNGEEADAGEIMREVLRAFGDQIKVLDLGNLIGNGLPEPDEITAERDAAASDREAFLKAAKSNFVF